MMNKLRRFISNWLGFSRTEVNGFLVLLPLTVLILFSRPLYENLISGDPSVSNLTSDAKLLDSLVSILHLENDSSMIHQPEKSAVRLFAFNPNTVSENQLEELGASKILSKRIVNYREKGGVFRIKRDLLKIYGMDSTLYHQLFDFIQLPEERIVIKKTTEESNIKIVRREATIIEKFDINKADTVQLKKIKGIGTVIANRIIKFRESLGGFNSIEQLSEVYGVDTVVFQLLKRNSFVDESFSPKQINLNTDNEKLLASHPYIRKAYANAIRLYRFQHGNFADVQDIRKISSIEPRHAERLIPYLKVKD